jgi:hypothetical protein
LLPTMDKAKSSEELRKFQVAKASSSPELQSAVAGHRGVLNDARFAVQGSAGEIALVELVGRRLPYFQVCGRVIEAI